MNISHNYQTGKLNNTFNRLEINKSDNKNELSHLNYTLPGAYKPLTIKNINFCGTNNQSTNLRLTSEFNNAFDNRDASKFLEYINDTLRSISNPSNEHANKFTCDIKGRNVDGSLTLSAKSKDQSNQITVDKNAHVQINNSDLGDIFITKQELEDKCGMKDDSKVIIGDGIRFLDPADQSNWPKMPIGREWPTADSSINNLLHLTTDISKQAIMFDSKGTPVGDAYNTKPKGIISVDPKDSSVIIAVQQQNNNKSIPIAPWAIAPFKVPDGKKALTVFPVENQFIRKYDDAVQAYAKSLDIIDNSVKDVVLNGKDQWQIDKQNGFMFIDPLKDANMAGALDSQANWSLFAVEGSDKVLVMRSIYRNSHGDQFKAFSLSGNAKYIEQELTAPRVGKGKQSTLAFKIDLVPLSSLKGISFNEFSQEDFKEQVTVVATAIKEKLTEIRRQTKSNIK